MWRAFKTPLGNRLPVLWNTVAVALYTAGTLIEPMNVAFIPGVIVHSLMLGLVLYGQHIGRRAVIEKLVDAALTGERIFLFNPTFSSVGDDRWSLMIDHNERPGATKRYAVLLHVREWPGDIGDTNNTDRSIPLSPDEAIAGAKQIFRDDWKLWRKAP